MEEFDLAKIVKDFHEELIKGNLFIVLRKHFQQYVPIVFQGRKDVDLTKETRLMQKLLLRPLEYFLCDGDPDEFFNNLRQFEVNKTVCAKVFKMAEPVYSCRDCGVDATCVLCIECFENSIHKNHKYKMSTSGGGGYCDCGDPEAWKNGASCLLHSPGSDSQLINEIKLPLELTNCADQLFYILTEYIHEMLTWSDPIKLPNDLVSVHNKSIITYVTMLFNDEVHTYKQVTDALVKAIQCSQQVAVEFATIVDREGRSIVKDGTFEDCKKVKDIIEKRTTVRNSAPLRVEVMHPHVVSHQNFAIRLLIWMKNIFARSNNLRNLYSEISISKSFKSKHLIVEEMLLTETQLWKAARVQYQQLLLSGILANPNCKRKFSIIFTKIYPELMSKYILDDHEHSLSAVSCALQIFTVPSLARMLILDYNLLEQLFSTFLSKCESHLIENKILKIEKSSDNSFRRAQAIIFDIKYALLCYPQENEWTDDLRNNFLNGFKIFSILLFYIQGADASKRRLETHIEFEPEWEGIFTLQIKLNDIYLLMNKWCSSDAKILTEACQICLNQLKLKDDIRIYEQINVFNHEIQVLKCDFINEWATVHQPLTRMLASLLPILLSKNLIIKEQFENISLIEVTEISLRTLVLVAQNQAQMWRRNGFSLQNQLYFYQSMKCRNFMYDKDIIMMQIFASEIDSNDFLIILIHKFGLLNWSRPEYDTEVTPDDFVKQIVVLAEYFLHLLIIIISERYVKYVGEVTMKDIQKHNIIHQLCITPLSHSDIINAVIDDDNSQEESFVENVLTEVAELKKVESPAEKNLYELKSNFLSCYSPYYYHYSKSEQSKSEEYVRSHFKNTNKKQAFYPVSLPKFCGSLSRITNILRCDVFLNLAKVILMRATAKYSKSSSDGQLEKILFLIGLAIEEDCNLNVESLNESSFTYKAQISEYNILKLMSNLINHPKIISPNIKDACLVVYEKLCQSAKVDLNLSNTDLLHSMELNRDKDETEIKAQIAAKRREKAFSYINKMQRHFIQENKELFESTSSSQTNDKNSQPMEGIEEDITFVALGEGCGQPVILKSVYTCILCQEEQDLLMTNRSPLVYCAFVQRSSVISQVLGESVPKTEADEYNPLMTPATIPIGTHTSTCGHAMHANCWHSFYDALISRESSRHYRMLVRSFDIQQKEFLCPMCEAISNTVLPILPPLHTIINQDGSDTEEMRNESESNSLDDWLGSLHLLINNCSFDGNSEPMNMDTSDQTSSSSSSSLKSRSKIFPIRLLGNIAKGIHNSLNYIPFRKDCSSENLNINEISTKFANDVYEFGLDVLPNQTDKRIPSTLWNTCAYTIMSSESMLRAENKPLFGSLSSQQSEAINCLIKLSGISYTFLNTDDIQKQCIFLLSRILNGTDDSILDCDMFHLLISLCFSLPCMRLKELTHHSFQTPSECFLIQLILTLHILQICVAGDLEFEKQEESFVNDNKEKDFFKDFYTQIRTNKGLSTNKFMNDSNINIEEYLKQCCLPYLRCCALLFHYLTSVPVPISLFESNTKEYEILCTYLGIPISLKYILTQSTYLDNILQRLLKPSTSYLKELTKIKFPLRVNNLIKLPNDYSQLINQLANFACPRIIGNEENRSPALCLVCGKLVCSQSYCCQVQLDDEGKNSVGAAMYHSRQCTAGIGLFIRVRDCQLLMLAKINRGCYSHAPFLDQHGETDDNLRRGNPLFLSMKHYKKLEHCWRSHAIVDFIVRQMEAHPNYLNYEWRQL